MGSTRRNIDMFHQICGDKALASVVLGTTNWGEVGEDVGKHREQQLAKTLWNHKTSSGSRILRFDKTQESAVALVDAILGQLKSREEDNVLQIQTELVELERRIPETAAGKKMRYMLEQLHEIQKERVNSEEAVASLEKQIAELQISVPRKIFLNYFVSHLELLHIMTNFAIGRRKHPK